MQVFTIFSIRDFDEEFYGCEALASTTDFSKAQNVMWNIVQNLITQDGYQHTGGYNRSYEYADFVFLERVIDGREDWLSVYILQSELL